MHRRIVAPLFCPFLLIWLVVAGCDQAAVSTPTPTSIVVSGATAMQPVLRALTDEFHRQHPNVLFDLREGGSTLGEERIMRGEIDMAVSTLLPAGAAVDEPNSRSAELVRTPIGIDGVAIVVHPNNPVDALSYTQLRDIFTGQLLDWADIGGKPGDIVLVSREDGSGARRLFEERIMGDKSVSLTAIVMPSSADVADFVATHPRAIGYVSIAYVSEPEPTPTTDADTFAFDIRVLTLEDVMPSRENLRDQSYLLVQPLYLVTQHEPRGWMRQFIDFALGPTGQEIVDRYHARIR